MNSASDTSSRKSENANVRPLQIFINIELLFDFESILFSIARFANEKFQFRKNLSQSFFNSLKFTNIDEFVNSFLNEDANEKCNDDKNFEEINEDKKENEKENFVEKNIEISREIISCSFENLKQNIIGNKIFLSVKPRLYTLSELYCLTNTNFNAMEFNEALNKNYQVREIIIYSREKYFIDIINELKMIRNLEKIFPQVSNFKLILFEEIQLNSINFNLSKNSENELFDDQGNKIIIFIDTQIEDIQKKCDSHTLKNFSSILFYKKQTKPKHNENSEYELLIEKINSLKIITETNESTTKCNNDIQYKNEIQNFKDLLSKEFIFKYSNKFINHKFKFLSLWRNNLKINKFTIKGKVVPGFKRGSKLLGVPTANIEIKQSLVSIQTGVYYGPFRFLEDLDESHEVYSGVLSIGYNPYFDNNCKTIEVFLTDYEGEDFYGKEVTLSIEGFIRTEASFENFSELVTSITYDIIVSNEILSNSKK